MKNRREELNSAEKGRFFVFVRQKQHTLSMENNGHGEILKYLNTLIFPEILGTCDR